MENDVAALRSLIGGALEDDVEARAFCTPRTLGRFIAAENGDVQKAAAALTKALAWRAKARPWETVCEACKADARAHNLRVVGTTADGLPVLYYCFGQSDNRLQPESTCAHLARAIEETARLLDGLERVHGEGAAPEQWVLAIDFHGYGLWDNNPALATQASSFMPFWPNRLKKALLISAPTVFSGLWSLLQGFMTEVTREKVQFAAHDALEKECGGWLGPEMTAWLVAECAENRIKGAETKSYWIQPAQPGAHDPRGTASWLATPERVPLPCTWHGGPIINAAASAPKRTSWW